MSENVQLITTVPDVGAISGEFSTTGDFFYVSSLKGITAYDVSNPRQPVPAGAFAELFFEGESMTYGERMVGDTLRRFVFVGIDLFAAPLTDPQRAHIGFDRFHVLDVTDPQNMKIIGDVRTQTSTHTIQCVDQGACDFAYTAGTDGKFDVIDLRALFTEPEPDNISVLKAVDSPAAAGNAVFASGAGHYWDFDTAGIGWHTGSGGAVAFDVSDPANPVPVQATNAKGIKTPYNDFILHNSRRPNGEDFKRNAAPDVDNGNVLLVTEEDYFNDGNEVECEQQNGNEAGTFQTWAIPNLNEPAAKVGGEPGQGTIEPLDIVNAPAEFGNNAPLSTPAGAFCSAHWFDFHGDGVVAQGYYQQGLWFEDVRDAKDIKYYGYFTPVASEVWDAYWVPKRNKQGALTGEKTNLVYTVDAVRGIDVLEVDLPSTGGGPAPDIDDEKDRDDNGGGGVGDTGGDRDDNGGGDVDDAGGDTTLPATGGGLGLLLMGAAALPAAAYIGRRRR